MTSKGSGRDTRPQRLVGFCSGYPRMCSQSWPNCHLEYATATGMDMILDVELEHLKNKSNIYLWHSRQWLW